MIDYEYNDYQPEPEQPKPQVNGGETVKWLEDHCGFRPIGLEW